MILDKELYGNYKMLSMDGGFLAYVQEKRMNWYLDRSLATKLNDKEFKLLFKTNGGARSEYYTLPLKNECVICGTKDDLSKHHVVPYQYRKFFPKEYKSRGSFDVLLLCVKHHNEYEYKADKFKLEILRKYGLENYISETVKVKRYFNRLKYYYDRIDKDSRINMVEYLEEYFNNSIDEILDEDEMDFQDGTEILMSHIKDYESFIIMWRKHFIDNTEAKFLPKEWVDEIEVVIKAY